MQEESLNTVVLDEWQYCLHCRRVSRKMEWRRVRGGECCPYEGCGSPFYGGSCAYHALRRCYPELPATPRRDTVYARNTVALLPSGYV